MSDAMRPPEPEGIEDALSWAVVEAIARRKGVDPTDLEPRLGEVVDPEALDRLFTSPSVDGRVRFSYDGFDVCVTSDAEVRLSPDGE